ncbi:hypothetical protein HZS_4447, partial [Henneguya salminicola]
MAVVYFIIDTCASMNQVISAGIGFIDVVKASIESVIKQRIRDSSISGKMRDRFMLVYYDQQHRTTYMSGFKENVEKLLATLKLIKCFGTSKLTNCLRDTFELINIHRINTGIETFSFGRKPFFLEPCTIIIFTNGRNSLFDSNKNIIDLNLTSQFEGTELYFEPYRWDEKLFAIRYIIDASCVNQCVSELTQIMDFGAKPTVLINFTQKADKKASIQLDLSQPSFNSSDNFLVSAQSINGYPNTPLLTSFVAGDAIFPSYIHIPTNQIGASVNWPIPEIYNLEPSLEVLPPRHAIPTIHFSATPTKIYTGLLNFDTFLIENDQLCQYLLSKNTEDVDFECHLPCANSLDQSVNKIFGFISLKHQEKIVNFNLLPFDYNKLVDLLDQLVQVQKIQPTTEWVCSFDYYIQSIPYYYIKSIRTQLKKLNIPNTFIGEYYNTSLSQTIVNYINKIMNQAKLRIETHNEQSRSLLPFTQPFSFINYSPLIVPTIEMNKFDIRKALLSQEIVDSVTPATFLAFIANIVGTSELEKTFFVYENLKPFHNPFDVDLTNIVEILQRMRTNLKNYSIQNTENRIMDEETKHCVAISVMGDYQSRVKEIDPDKLFDPSAVRQTTFGSPFKSHQPKEVRFSANEADIQLSTHIENSRSAFYKMRMERRRKTYKVLSLDTLSTISSPSENETDLYDISLPYEDISGDEKLTLSKSYYLMQQLPYRDYLNQCYLELRNYRPSIYSCYDETCLTALPAETRRSKYPIADMESGH